MKKNWYWFAICIAAWLLVLAACQPAPAPPPQAQTSAAPAQPVASSKPALSSDPLIAGFQQTALASVCDAIDQVCHHRGYMAHDMRPWIGHGFVGRAVTALVKPARPGESTPETAVKHPIEMIDQAQPGEVGVIVFQHGLEIAALGGLMATAAKARGMAGMVLDGAIRDIEEVRRIGLPVFARAASPANAVGRFKSVAKNIPVRCAGVMVHPGDIIVAGEDGVVVVPKDKAAAVLKVAREIDRREDKMVPFIKREKSLEKAVKIFNRI